MLRAAIAEARAFESWQDYQEALKLQSLHSPRINCSEGLYRACAHLEKSPNMSSMGALCICTAH